MATVGRTVAYLGIEWHVQGTWVDEATVRERIVVRRVIPGSPAAKAGLKVGDAVQAIDGVLLDNQTTLSKIIQTRKPGAIIQVAYERAAKTHTAKITLGERQLPAFKFKPIEPAERARSGE